MSNRRQFATTTAISSTEAAAAAAAAAAQFEAAVRVVDSLPRNASGQAAAAAFQRFKPTTGMMLRFYALYKQAKFGPCREPRPAFWDLVGKVKWDAWRALGDLPSQQAMLEYSGELRRIIESLPDASPEVSGLIDKVGNFYSLVDTGDLGHCAGAANATAEDIKRGLRLANRIRLRSGSGSGSGGGGMSDGLELGDVGMDDENDDDRLDVNSNFLTRSLPPAGSSKSNGVGHHHPHRHHHLGSQPDIRRPPPHPADNWPVFSAAAARPLLGNESNNNNTNSNNGANSDSDSDADVFCDSYDNFLHLETSSPQPPPPPRPLAEEALNVSGDEAGDLASSSSSSSSDDDESEPGDVTGGGGETSGRRGGGSGGGRHHQRSQQAPQAPSSQQQHHQHHIQQQRWQPSASSSINDGGRWSGENGGGNDGGSDRGGGGGSGGGSTGNLTASERQMLDQLRHIRAALDRLVGDLGRVNTRLESLQPQHQASPPRPSSRSQPLSLWLFGGMSLKTVVLLLAWPLIVQLLWRLPWRSLMRRLLRRRLLLGGRRSAGARIVLR